MILSGYVKANDAARAKIAKQTAAFEKAGGVITSLPSNVSREIPKSTRAYNNRDLTGKKADESSL